MFIDNLDKVSEPQQDKARHPDLAHQSIQDIQKDTVGNALWFYLYYFNTSS
jgi:hypothetical protein